jgi:hypothetical protein
MSYKLSKLSWCRSQLALTKITAPTVEVTTTNTGDVTGDEFVLVFAAPLGCLTARRDARVGAAERGAGGGVRRLEALGRPPRQSRRRHPHRRLSRAPTGGFMHTVFDAGPHHSRSHWRFSLKVDLGPSFVSL